MNEPSLAFFVQPLSWAVFFGASALAILLGTILVYHWFRYAMNPSVAFTAFVTYAVVTGFLLSGLLAATIAVNIAQ